MGGFASYVFNIMKDDGVGDEYGCQPIFGVLLFCELD